MSRILIVYIYIYTLCLDMVTNYNIRFRNLNIIYSLLICYIYILQGTIRLNQYTIYKRGQLPLKIDYLKFCCVGIVD
jgi:hypothetical protein